MSEHNLDEHFPRFVDHEPLIHAWNATPTLNRTIHRFFDSSPFSPSGRYLALTRFPFEERYPAPGDRAQIVLVDLESGSESVVASTAAWDTQLGSQVQWGATDQELCYNDLDETTWRPRGVIHNPETGSRRWVNGAIYHVSADGSKAASPNLERYRYTQLGYGVVIPDQVLSPNVGAADDDGLYVTDLKSGASELIVSFRQLAKDLRLNLQDSDPQGAYYGAHAKWNNSGDRLMFVVRFLRSSGARDRMIVTLNPDGSDLRLALDHTTWSFGGHHPGWCPDGESILMNLNHEGKGMRFVRVDAEGSKVTPITGLPGSGHPSLTSDERYLLTDEYHSGPMSYPDGTVPIRLVDVSAGTERRILRVDVKPRFMGPDGGGSLPSEMGNALRVDPHPAWDRHSAMFAYNACVDGSRHVFVATLEDLE